MFDTNMFLNLTTAYVFASLEEGKYNANLAVKKANKYIDFGYETKFVLEQIVFTPLCENFKGGN